MPVTVIDGLVPGARQDVAGADRLDALEQSGLVAQLLLVVLGRLGLVRVQPLDGDRAVLLPEGGEQFDRGEHRVRHLAAEHARVRGVVEGRDAEVEGHRAAQPDGQAG